MPSELRFNNLLIRNPFKIVFVPEKYTSTKRSLKGTLKVIKYVTGSLDNVKISFNRVDNQFLVFLKTIDNTFVNVKCTITGYEFSGSYFIDVPQATSDNMTWYDDIEITLTRFSPQT